MTDLPTIGSLEVMPAVEHPELLAPSVHRALLDWELGGTVSVIEIDPGLADTAALTDAYDLPLTASANCVVVAGKRAGEERVAACVVTADTRADVNNLVKRVLDVRKASFLAVERAVAESGMEYGGITPIGLAAQWRVLLDARVAADPGATLVVGSGVRRSKLALPAALLAAMPGAEVVDGLALA